MAEEKKTGAGKLESEDGKGNTEVNKGNDVPESPDKPNVNGSEEPSNAHVSGKEKISDRNVNGVGKSPAASVNSIGESSAGSPGKDSVLKEVDSKEQNGRKTEARPEDGQDDEKPEGNKSFDSTICMDGLITSFFLFLAIKWATLTGVES